jgi:CheY-like chemotaxis protein
MTGLWTISIGLAIDPSSPPPPFSAKPSDDRASSKMAARKILVVDDEATIAETLVEILKGEGFEAVAAYNGDEALELARSFKPDIVLSDVVIPGPNGVETGIQIRQFLPRCVVILFSGQAETADLLRDARARGHEFQILAKPIRPQTLLDTLKRQRPG